MATRQLIGTSTDFEAVANWSGAAAPVTGDNVYISEGSQTFANNMSQGDQDFATLRFGPYWQGKILTTNPLITGTNTSMYVDCPSCTELAIQQNDGDTTTNTYIYNTGPGLNGLYLNAGAAQTGTYTNVYIVRGNVHIGPKATITNLYIYRPASVTIDSGAAITTVNMFGGDVNNEAAITTINLWGGTWKHIGDTTVNITTLNVHADGAVFYLESYGATIGVIHAYGGLVDGTTVGHANTVNSASAGTIQRGARVHLNQQTTVTNAFNDFSGGDGYRGPDSSTTIIVPEVPL